MLNLEEQQAQLSHEKEQLMRELEALRATTHEEHEASAKRDAERTVQSREHAASSALLSSLARTAQVTLPTRPAVL